MKKIAIMQPYIFPYIGYFQLIYSSDIFVLYNDVHWINRGWINRNRILLDAQPHTFTIPCKKTSQNKLIQDIEISMEEKANNKLLATIQRAYQKAPYFNEIFPGIKSLLDSIHKSCKIDEFANNSINWVLQYLSIKRTIHLSSLNYADSKGMDKADRLIQICKQENCDTYINSPGGKHLYQKEYFRDNGVNLYFLEPMPVSYTQFGNPFESNLSIIDVLMFNSKEKVLQLLQQYELV